MVVFAPGGGVVKGPPVTPLSGGVEVFLTRGFCATSNSTPTYTATNGFSVFTYALTGGQRMQEY
jgi:hypothetical protein